MSHPSEGMCAAYFTSVVLETIEFSGWVAGGAIRDWFIFRKITSDVDVWFSSEEKLQLAKGKCESAGWKLTSETDSSVNFRSDSGKWVQLVKKHYFPTLQETVAAFDFTVCSAGTDGKEFVAHSDFFIDLAMRRLALNRITFAVSTWKRAMKYAQKGFALCPDEQKKLLDAMKLELADFTTEEINSRYME